MYRLEDLVEGVLIKRLNRFVVEVSVNNMRELAHNTNTGRLTDFLVSGRRVLLERIGSKRSRTSYRLIGVEDPVERDFAVIDTLTQNKVFETLVNNNYLPWLRGCRVASRNPVYEDAKLDFLVECPGRRYLIETKSAVLRGERNEAMYPDCPTERGRRHIKRLIEMTRDREYEPMIVFIAAMKNTRCFKPYRDGDKIVEELVAEAIRAGVSVKALSIYMKREGHIILDNPDVEICIDWLEEHGIPRPRY